MAQEYRIEIHEDSCIGCGACVRDCVCGNLAVEDGTVKDLQNRCILCGHCEAVCPVHAIELAGFEDIVEDFDRDTRLDPKTLLQAIKTRRSVRHFTAEKVPHEVRDLIIEAGRQAPTGSNAQVTSYVVIEDRIAELEAEAVEVLNRMMAGAGTDPTGAKRVSGDFFFKGAPMAIVILGKDAVSASLAAENMAFMAEACGLGVLYSGYFTACVSRSREMRAHMGLTDEKAVTTLVLGYPDVTYLRTVHRKPAVVQYL